MRFFYDKRSLLLGIVLIQTVHKFHGILFHSSPLIIFNPFRKVFQSRQNSLNAKKEEKYSEQYINQNVSDANNIPIGLRNLQNTCYLNSVIQLLFNCKAVRDLVLRTEYHPNSVGQNIRLLFEQLSDGKNDSVSPTYLVRSLNIDISVQEDAQELLLKLINEVDNSINEDESRVDESNKQKSGRLSDLFQGKFNQTITCVNVNYTKQKTQKFLDLSVSLESDDVVDAISDILEPELLDGENQFKAGEHGYQDAVKQVQLGQLPPVLLVHLKRFGYNENTGRMRKVNDYMSFPEILNLTNIVADADFSDSKPVYDLLGAVIHEGTINFGHYTYIGRRSPNCSSWFEFNDQIVTPVDTDVIKSIGYGGQSGIASKNAYILLYARR